MLRLSLAFLCSAGLFTALAQEPKKDAAKEKPKAAPRIAINDPAKLIDDADFATQGEYAGLTAEGKELGSVHRRGGGLRCLRGGCRNRLRCRPQDERDQGRAGRDAKGAA